MQDVRTSESIPQDTNLWKRKTAAALADIHTDNLMCADQLPHLPHADEEYWNHITTQISISHLEKRCAEDNAFAARYAGMLPKLHKCAERFVHDMTALYRDGTSLTVTHGDLQTIHGDHVRCFQGKICILHWYNTIGDPVQDWTIYCPFFVKVKRASRIPFFLKGTV